jgi:hypothetical protein
MQVNKSFYATLFDVRESVFLFLVLSHAIVGLQCTVGQDHTKAGQNSIFASSSNKLVKSAFIFFKPLED